MKTTLERIVSDWWTSSSILARMLDLTLIGLLLPFASTVAFSLLLYGLSITLTVFETLWLIAFLFLSTLALRLHLTSLQATPHYNEQRGIIERKILLYWALCFLIGIVMLSLSLVFPFQEV